ncbi:hypothetical protein ABZ402_50560 [Streptomyces mirabilis]|uniref:hypothetical protein n=1 Tax=Streptomyces mirabilis TaxID=68239 RepID=UPI00340B0807
MTADDVRMPPDDTEDGEAEPGEDESAGPDDDEVAGPEDDEPAGQEPITTRLQQLAEAIGPTTLATALLVYFGYVATRARYEYFGVPLELTGLSNQTLLLDGLEVVYVPAALIFLGVLAAIALHAAISWHLAHHPDDIANTFLASGIALVGVLLIVRALIGVFVQGTETSVVIGTTPISLALGPSTVIYGVWAYGKSRGRPLLSARLTRSTVVCAIVLGAAGLFWASTQIAWAYGTGRGEEDAHELAQRPEIILDTKEALAGLPSGVTETQLGGTNKDASFSHRYRGFRLLLSSGGRLFLVTPTWTLGRDQTIVVRDDSDIRIQLVSQP